MHIGYIPVMFMFLFALSVHAQETDSLKTIQLNGVVVVGESYKKSRNRNSALTVEIADKDFLNEHFTGNLIQTLGHIPGIHSMDIGSGFSKPMIRGMGFNRILVTENGIKQEGQQWGADHGLETDAFGVERVVVRKGPSSLLYGSDAMGGAIEIMQLPAPPDNQLFGEFVFLGKSVNGTLGGSVMLGIKKNAWFTKIRFSEQHFGDYRIPVDTIVYLTQRMPVYGKRLKNTAGFERDIGFYTEYRKGSYSSDYAVSDACQKVGFFPCAHGIPDISRLQDDRNSYNIELPYSTVNHLKVTTCQKYIWDKVIGTWNSGYQNNFRKELSKFHTHYGTQPVPEKDPDKELAFSLNTYSTSIKLRLVSSDIWEYTAGSDMQYQQNRISGYSFLLPEYNRFTAGVFGLATYRLNNDFSVSGGTRYDYGYVDISAYMDSYLEIYLQEKDYANDLVEAYKWRSYAVNRNFGDFSSSLGIVWNPGNVHLIKVNLGRSFRLPGVNELSANGVHHGTFRHEQGDPSLSSEQGWQLDVSYTYEYKNIFISISPFTSWYNNYIYLKPTGEWSVLPHAGQIYRYTGAEVIFAGTEFTFGIDFLHRLNYQLMGEYVYTRNRDEHIPLSFSPPASMRNILTWKRNTFRIYAEVKSIASQNRVAWNEQRTPGANLLHAGASINIPFAGTALDVSLSFQNLLNTKFYNHLSFYRKVEIPEPGRNFQLLIKVPFKSQLK